VSRIQYQQIKKQAAPEKVFRSRLLFRVVERCEEAYSRLVVAAGIRAVLIAH
jgi:hypothetical protein